MTPDVRQPITIRRATIADLDCLVEHRVAMFRDMGHADEGMLASVGESARRYFQAAVPKGEYVAWLADAGGVVVAGAGVVIAAWPGGPWEPQSRRAWILNVYTAPDWRRRGIARRLTQTALDWCRAAGFHIVSLHASAEGRALYESLGFKPTNEMRLTL